VLSDDDVPRTMQGEPNAVKIMALEMVLNSVAGK